MYCRCNIFSYWNLIHSQNDFSIQNNCHASFVHQSLNKLSNLFKYSNLHRVVTQKTPLLTQTEDIKYIERSKRQPQHSKNSSGWWGHCCCSLESGPRWSLVSSGSRGWTKLSTASEFSCLLLRKVWVWGIEAVLCRAFIVSLFPASLAQLSRVQSGTQSKSPLLLHFFQVLVFVQALCDKRIPSKAY